MTLGMLPKNVAKLLNKMMLCIENEDTSSNIPKAWAYKLNICYVEYSVFIHSSAATSKWVTSVVTTCPSSVIQ